MIARTHVGSTSAANDLPTSFTLSPRTRVPMTPQESADYRMLLERAHALVPLLRERAPEAEKRRRLTDDVVKAVADAGLLRILRPRPVGGYALPAMIFYDVCSILARGCASTAWVVANLSSKEMMLALWPKAGQDEVWGANGEKGDALMAASYVFPAGRAERVPGGYKLSGRWPFCSGVLHGRWAMLGAMVKGEDGALEKRLFLVPAAQYTIIDNWHVTGLKATGSVDIEARDVFVADHMTLADADCHSLAAPGLAHHAAPIFRFPIAASAPYILVAVVYGAACMALEEFTASVKKRVARSTGGNMAEFSAVQGRIAEAAACLDAADLLSRKHLDDTMLHIASHLDNPKKLPEEQAVRARRDAAFVAQLCVRAVDLVFASGGGTALFESSPIERAWRDVHAGVAQITLQWDIAGPAWGRVALGLPSGLAGV